MAVGDRRFLAVPQPSIPEWIEPARALNVMVAKVQAMLEEKQTEIEGVREELDHDPLTGTASRHRFMTSLQQALRAEPNQHDGSLAIIHVHMLAEMNQRVGRHRTDEFLKAVATTIRTRLYRFSPQQPLLARLNGSDFGVLLDDVSGPRLVDWLDGVAGALKQLYDERVSDTMNVAWIGATTFRQGESLSEVMVRVDAMVMAAEARREPFAVTSPTQPLHFIAVAQWRVMIENALETGRVHLDFFPVVDTDMSPVHWEGVMRLLSPDGTVLHGSTFVPPAIRTARIVDIDLRAVELGLARIDASEHSVAVNIAPQSIRRPYFVQRVEALLVAAGPRARRLWIEVSEWGLMEHASDLESFSNTVRRHGVKIGIDHFGIAFSALPTLHHLHIDYVKLDARFCNGAASDLGKQQYAKLVVELASALGIDVLAQGLGRPDDVNALLAMGVRAVTGPIVTAAVTAPHAAAV